MLFLKINSFLKFRQRIAWSITIVIIFNSSILFGQIVESEKAIDAKSTIGPLGLNSDDSITLVNNCGSSDKAFFTNTKKKYDELNLKLTEFVKTSCSTSAIDLFLSNRISDFCALESSKGLAGCTETKGDSTIQNNDKITAACRKMETDIENLDKEVLTLKDNEKQTCDSKASSLHQAAEKIKDCQSVSSDFATNLRACQAVAQEVKTKSEKLLAFAREHWMWIAGALGAVGTGGYMLMKSGKKQKDDLTTNPETNIPNIKVVNNKTTTEPTTTDATQTTTPPAPAYQRPSDQAFCQNTIRPIECFVTPACDLTCAAARYGVENYTGMGNDTRMIDKNGNIVDPTTARAKNPGASGSAGSGSGGGGGSGSGSGGPGELGSGHNENASNNSINTRNEKSFNYDGDSGFGGKGFGNDGDSFGRDPAMASGKVAVNFQSTQKNPIDPAATGPILPSKDNIFTIIYDASRAQCVRDLVDCSGGK